MQGIAVAEARNDKVQTKVIAESIERKENISYQLKNTADRASQASD